MSRGIVIAGNESPLFLSLCGEAAKRAETYAAAPIPASPDAPLPIVSAKTEAPQGTDAANKQILLEWNSSSPVSARTLVLSATNRMEYIDKAILVCVPPSYRKTAEEMVPAEIDRLVDSNIKSWFFLVREFAKLFSGRKQGLLSLVVSEINSGPKEDVTDLFAPAAVSAFRDFAQRTLISSLTAPYNAMGFSYSEHGKENAFAAHVFKTMEDEKRNSGKWYRYGKLGFLGR